MWNNNIQKLKSIETEDPIFWQYIIDLALCLQKNNNNYIDNHRLNYLNHPNIFIELDFKDSNNSDISEFNANNKDIFTDPYIFRKLDTITICRTLINKEYLLNESKDSSKFKLNSWAIPGPSENCCLGRTKNPLYIRNDQVHLTTCARGYMLNHTDETNLLKGMTVIQERTFWNNIKEINYTLPIDLFIQTILEVIYQPDGLGYLEAKKDFQQLVSQYN